MSIQSASRFAGVRWLGREVEWEAAEENLSSDGGLLLLGQLDEQLGGTESFSELITDRRRRPEHSAWSMVCQRVFGIIAGYEDQNDHDTLRSDVIFKLMAHRTPTQEDLASQPSLSRLENAVTGISRCAVTPRSHTRPVQRMHNARCSKPVRIIRPTHRLQLQRSKLTHKRAAVVFPQVTHRIPRALVAGCQLTAFDVVTFGPHQVADDDLVDAHPPCGSGVAQCAAPGS